MNNEENVESNIERTKNRVKWGCLIWFLLLAMLVLIPIISYVVSFIYNTQFKESIIVTSQSPSRINTIEIVEKGEPVFFGPSTVRLKSGAKHIDRSISNDGKILGDSNITVSWENDSEATITLYGEEQVPEVIKFNAEESTPFELGQFEMEQYELGSFTFKTSDSPNLTNIIEFREVTNSKGSILFSTVHIYYGKRGSVLEEYKEYIPSDIYIPDNFNVKWKNDVQVTIDVIRENKKGETYIEDSFEIDIAK